MVGVQRGGDDAGIRLVAEEADERVRRARDREHRVCAIRGERLSVSEVEVRNGVHVIVGGGTGLEGDAEGVVAAGVDDRSGGGVGPKKRAHRVPTNGGGEEVVAIGQPKASQMKRESALVIRDGGLMRVATKQVFEQLGRTVRSELHSGVKECVAHLRRELRSSERMPIVLALFVVGGEAIRD